jgi:hypothetical protein
VGHEALIGDIRNAQKFILRKHEEQISLGALRHRWEDNIILDLKRNRVGVCELDSSGSG